MKSLALCMIVKDEEACLGNCLSSVKDCFDEIIIVDTGSIDKTKEIAKKYTDKIFDYQWEYDFSKARNFSFDKSSSEYNMWLDADDILLDETVKKIKEWKEYGEECDCMMCKYVTSFDENFTPLFEFSRERIIRNSPNLRWQDPIHEVITPNGKILFREDIVVYHNKKNKPFTDRNLNIYKKMIQDGKKFSPRQQFYYARELYFNNLIDEAIHQFSIFLSEGKGWKENNIEACLNLAKCYQRKGEINNSLTALFGSFIYGVPRGEILYEIGRIFEGERKIKEAIYWYKEALQSNPNIESGGFVNTDCYNFLPALQLCVCYYKIGDIENSFLYHKLSKEIKPNDKNVIYNDKFFKNLLKNKG